LEAFLTTCATSTCRGIEVAAHRLGGPTLELLDGSGALPGDACDLDDREVTDHPKQQDGALLFGERSQRRLQATEPERGQGLGLWVVGGGRVGGLLDRRGAARTAGLLASGVEEAVVGDREHPGPQIRSVAAEATEVPHGLE